MKNYIFYIMLSFLAIHAGAQKNYQSVAEKFQLFYNQEQGDSIFNMYAPVLKGQLPLEKNRAVISGLHIQFGELKSLSLLKQDTGWAKYKASFKDQTLTLVLALNKEDQIEGLRFIPFSPDQPADQKNKSNSNIFLKIPKGNIYGTLLIPEGSKKPPVVFIIAGSGPTDRNGNQGTAIFTNTYKMIADSLARKGIATVRYDKRGVGESMAAMGSEADLTFEDGINDAVGFVQMLKSDSRFSKVIVLGHSEGSLIGMVAAARAQADGYISVSGAGERADKIIEQQLKVQSPALAAKATILFDSLMKGYQVESDPELVFLFRPSVQPYIRSWLKYDPHEEIKKLKMPVLIIQGTTDMQVSVQDARWLKASDPNASLVLIDQMNHVLKQSGSDKKENAGTYTNPALPLKPELVRAIETFVLNLKK